MMTMNRVCARTLLLALLVMMAGVSVASGIATAQETVLNPAVISGTVTIQGETLYSVNAYASATGSSASGSASGSAYRLTVNVPPIVYTVVATGYFSGQAGSSGYLTFPAQQATVSAGNTTTADFVLTPGWLDVSVRISGATLNYAYVYANGNGGSSGRYIPGQSGTGAVPVVGGPNQIWVAGYAYTTAGTQISLPGRWITLGPGERAPVAWTVEAPQGGTLEGTVSMTHASPGRLQVCASSTVWRCAHVDASGAYRIADLPPGYTYVYVYSWFDNDSSFVTWPDRAFAPQRRVTVIAGATTRVDMHADAARVTGTISISGARTTADLAMGYVYATGWWDSPAAFGSGWARIEAGTGAYAHTLTAGGWTFGNVSLSFYKAEPYLQSNLSILEQQAPNTPVSLVAGGNVTRDVSYRTGTVTLTLRAVGMTFSSPWVAASCWLVGPSGLVWQYWAYGYGNQSNVSQGTVTFVGLEGHCDVDSYAYIGGSSTHFGRVAVDVVPGSSQAVDVGGPSLVVQSPQPDFISGVSSVTVTGTATDDVAVATVTVNGINATVTPTVPNDPRGVTFTAAEVPLGLGPNEVVTVATDTSGKQATDTRTVYYDTGAPGVSWTPADGQQTTETSVVVLGRATDDAGIASIAVNGNSVSFTPTGGANNEVQFSTIVSLVEGSNTIAVTVRDVSTRTTTEVRTISRVVQQTQTITVDGLPTSVPYGTTFAVVARASSGDSVALSVSGVCSIAEVTVTMTSGIGECQITASQSGDARYRPAVATATVTASRATQSISWASPASTVYGTALDGTQLNATATGSGPAPAGMLAYTPVAGTVLGAGSHTLSVTASATEHYEAATATVTLVVEKANQTIAWSTPTPILYGTTLGSTQLSATVSVPGSSAAGALTYSPAAGAILDAGIRTLGVTAAGTANYKPATATVTLVVEKANQTIAWATPAPIVYGTALGSAQLNARVNVPGPSAAGAVTYTPAAGAILDAGSHTLAVAVAETTNYLAATASVMLVVQQAPTSTVVVSSLNPSTLGQAVTFTATVSASYGTPAGTVVFRDGTEVLGTATLAGGQASITTAALPVRVRNLSASYGGSANYLSSASAVLAQHVRYEFVGFFSPVQNPAAVNVGRAGRTYPLKWQLKDAGGTLVVDLGTVTSISTGAASCATFAAPDTETLVESSGASALRWDATDQQYVFNWQTSTVTGCYVLSLTLGDGTTHSANFSLK